MRTWDSSLAASARRSSLNALASAFILLLDFFEAFFGEESAEAEVREELASEGKCPFELSASSDLYGQEFVR